MRPFALGACRVRVRFDTCLPRRRSVACSRAPPSAASSAIRPGLSPVLVILLATNVGFRRETQSARRRLWLSRRIPATDLVIE